MTGPGKGRAGMGGGGPVDHASARKLALAGQAAAVVMLGVTGLFAFAWAPGTAVPEPVAFEPPVIEVKAPEAGEPTDDFVFDPAGMTERFGMTRNAPTPPEPDQDEEKPSGPINPDEGTTTAPPPPTTVSALEGVKYLGSLRDPRSARALVSVDGRQRIVAVGGEINGYTLDEVGAEVIRLSSDSDSLEIAKAQANRSPIAGGGPNPALMPNPNEPFRPQLANERLSNEDIRNMTREERQALMEKQRERLRQQREQQGAINDRRRGEDGVR